AAGLLISAHCGRNFNSSGITVSKASSEQSFFTSTSQEERLRTRLRADSHVSALRAAAPFNPKVTVLQLNYRYLLATYYCRSTINAHHQRLRAHSSFVNSSRRQ